MFKRETRLKGRRRPWPEVRLLPGPRDPSLPVPAAPAAEARLLVLTNEEHCTGPWAVPPRFAAKAILGELVLDLREATFPAECWLDVDAVMAQVRILLPPGVRVTLAVQDYLGEAKDKRAPYPVGSDAPHVVLTGSAWLAEIQLRDR